jgi:hypothetical protein
VGGQLKFRKGDLAHRLILDPLGRVVGEEVVTISDVYSDMGSRFGPYPELYEITRPNGEVSRGYLPHGLRKI